MVKILQLVLFPLPTPKSLSNNYSIGMARAAPGLLGMTPPHPHAGGFSGSVGVQGSTHGYGGRERLREER